MSETFTVKVGDTVDDPLMDALSIAGLRIAALEAENARLKAALERLGSSEAFTPHGAIDPHRDAELLARITYARAALKEKQ